MMHGFLWPCGKYNAYQPAGSTLSTIYFLGVYTNPLGCLGSVNPGCVNCDLQRGKGIRKNRIRCAFLKLVIFLSRPGGDTIDAPCPFFRHHVNPLGQFDPLGLTRWVGGHWVIDTRPQCTRWVDLAPVVLGGRGARGARWPWCPASCSACPAGARWPCFWVVAPSGGRAKQKPCQGWGEPQARRRTLSRVVPRTPRIKNQMKTHWVQGINKHSGYRESINTVGTGNQQHHGHIGTMVICKKF